ncbi:MAG: tail fiber domain-containing protein [Nitrospina sp.]|nr:tail fiber domain-containing protein [Nitrospina sp.]
MSTINYTVTVSGGLFLVDGASKPKLTFRDGDTYVFDQADSSNASNTFRFSATSDNSGASEYTTGVTVTGTAGSAGAKTTIVTSSSTTDTLYYYSGDTAGYGEEFSNSGYNTTSEGILKPIVGGAGEKWGPMLNHSIDQLIDKTVPASGGTFTGAVTASAGVIGNLTGNASGTAATVTTAAQPAITSVGTLTALTGGTGDFNWDSNTLVVDSSASKVGIGTAAPTQQFESYSTSTHRLRVSNANYGIDLVQLAGGSSPIINAYGTDTSLLFHINDAEKMRINNSGNVGIGTTSPGNRKLSVIASVADFAMNIQNNLGNGSGQGLIIYAGTNGGAGGAHISFRSPNGTTVGAITQNSGSTVLYGASSDYRLKENVVAMSGSIDRLKLLKPSRFNFIMEPDYSMDGFLAHEAQAVVPEAVSGVKDGMITEEYEITPAVVEVVDEDGNITAEAVDAVMGEREVPDIQGVDQSKLVPLLVSALQEAIARIETLESA